MEILGYGAVAMLAYLLGSLPTGYLVARAKGIDIRSVGSGNIGATNVFRILGKPAGVFVLATDALKGYAACRCLPALVAQLFGAAGRSDAPSLEWAAVVAGLLAVLGHNYTVWLRFKGGKGIATSAGVLIALVPWALLTILTIWLVVFAASRYVSLASIAAAFSLPFAAWLVQRSSPGMIAITAGMAILAIYKHKANIQRLLHGTESRIGAAKKNGGVAP